MDCKLAAIQNKTLYQMEMFQIGNNINDQY